MNKFVQFTDPSSKPVWIAVQWVTKITVIPRGEYASGARTLISMGGSSQAVQEDPEEVIKMLETEE